MEECKTEYDEQCWTEDKQECSSTPHCSTIYEEKCSTAYRTVCYDGEANKKGGKKFKRSADEETGVDAETAVDAISTENVSGKSKRSLRRLIGGAGVLPFLIPSLLNPAPLLLAPLALSSVVCLV